MHFAAGGVSKATVNLGIIMFRWVVGILLVLMVLVVARFHSSNDKESSVRDAGNVPLAHGAEATDSVGSMSTNGGGRQVATPVRLTGLIADEIAKNGISSPRAYDLIMYANFACHDHSERARSGAKPAGWAEEYLAGACEGFDATQYKGLQEHGPALIDIGLEQGDGAAAEAGLVYLRRPESMAKSTMAGMALIGQGKLGDQSSYGLNQDQLGKAFQVAVVSTMCPGSNGCASAPILAASVCAEMACPPGTTYEAALRRNLAPAELEAVNKLRAWLVSIRQ